MNSRQAKAEYLAARKMELVNEFGCVKCGTGKSEGFEKYWDEDSQYIARRFVFKYTDSRGSNVPVAQLPRLKTTTTTTIDEALTRCVILCRSCADPRRTRKEVTQCQKSVITKPLPPSS